MPQDLPDADYIAAFKDELGLPRNGGVVTDKLGLPLAVTGRLFVTDAGVSKIAQDRKEVIRLLARTLGDPDEIWMSFEPRNDGTYRLARRYLALFQTGKQNLVVVFEETKDGWRAVTAFPNDDASGRYLDNAVRGGFLAYRRPQ